MQDEVNEKVVSLCIRGGKISAQILKKCIIKNFDKAGTAEIPEEAKERGI